MEGLRTWIEIDKKALHGNTEQFLKLVPEKTRLMAVVKSNAYGHGLIQVSKFLSSKFYTLGASRLWFGVDSIVEALALRREGIKNSILVLGSTLPVHFVEATKENIIVTISNFDSLRALAKEKNKPALHLKIDTGMHRQGFFPKDVLKLIKFLKSCKLSPQGVYTHFAAAKDAAYPTYTLTQLRKFNEAVSKFKKAGFSAEGGSSPEANAPREHASGGNNLPPHLSYKCGGLICHAAASGGALLFPEAHLDMVRVGMALYGYFPSSEVRLRNDEVGLPIRRRVNLKPVLTWKTLVVEVKEIPAGSYLGYDLTEKVARKTKIAVLPVGYWHGYDRGLSSVGEVLIKGRRAKVLGRVSMDMIVVDITDIDGKSKFQNPNIKVGDEAVLVGKQGGQAIWADELALKIGTSQYEFLTRINPLIQREII